MGHYLAREQTLIEILAELKKMNKTLNAMKQQEFDYWETWKKKKEKELKEEN